MYNNNNYIKKYLNQAMFKYDEVLSKNIQPTQSDPTNMHACGIV